MTRSSHLCKEGASGTRLLGREERETPLVGVEGQSLGYIWVRGGTLWIIATDPVV
jgi:hypothetical protein